MDGHRRAAFLTVAILSDTGRNPVTPMSAAPAAFVDAAAADMLRRAAAGVARVEVKGTLATHVGTAFAISPRLLVTSRQAAESVLGAGNGPAALDFADAPQPADARVEVKSVHLVHPYWQIAFLTTATDLPAERVLKLADTARRGDVMRRICAIGYPAEDARNDADRLAAVYGVVRPEKYWMLGDILGWDSFGPEDSRVLSHTASTLGGVTGAPLVDLADGSIIGVHLTGDQDKANWATPAWEAVRDPQWLRLMEDDACAPDIAVAHVDPEEPLLPHADILALAALLVALGFDTLPEIDLLMSGLPPVIRAALPAEATAQGTLIASLSELNRMRTPVGGTVPIAYVLDNAKALRPLAGKPVDDIVAIRARLG